MDGRYPEELGDHPVSLLEARRELRRLRQKLRQRRAELAEMEYGIKRALLSGAIVEPGRRLRLRLLPGCDSASKNPDDYVLLVR